MTSWTAVVKGAVMCGMGMGAHNAVLVKPVSRHYGIIGSENHTAWKHQDARIVVDQVHGSKMALDQITWLINKGDVILPTRPIRAGCRIACTYRQGHINNQSTLRVRFCATREEEPPKRAIERTSPAFHSCVLLLMIASV